MQDWGYAQAHPDEQLARLYRFSMMKIEPGKEIPMVITFQLDHGGFELRAIEGDLHVFVTHQPGQGKVRI